MLQRYVHYIHLYIFLIYAQAKWSYKLSQVSCGTFNSEPCQNVLAAGNFAAFSQFLAAYSTLDFTGSPLAGKGTWHLLPTTPAMLPTAEKHFDSIQPQFACALTCTMSFESEFDKSEYKSLQVLARTGSD